MTVSTLGDIDPNHICHNSWTEDRKPPLTGKRKVKCQRPMRQIIIPSGEVHHMCDHCDRDPDWRPFA